MTPPISFFAHGIPVGQPRVKAARHGGFVRVYTPPVANEWKQAIKDAVKLHWNGEQIEGPVECLLKFYYTRPQYHYKPDGGVRDVAPKHWAKNYDADNLAKAVMDALTDSEIWDDDKQVVHLDVWKYYCDYPHDAGCAITIRQVEE